MSTNVYRRVDREQFASIAVHYALDSNDFLSIFFAQA